jgi:diguanylate cyclase (GGDEF)-like protein
LTGVSNRAELDRIHPEAVARHLAQGTHYSLIICDIDRFKSINDKFGHQAGDEALVSFASVLKASCRADDVIARYGGEEFVVLCEYCDAGEATQLAEKIRLELTRTPLAELSGQSITASFGVTELQAGDSAETMLHRADRGLLQAKDTGRNRVVRLGNVAGEDPEAGDGQNWWPWSRRTTSKQLIETWLITKVPLQVAVEKLRGFIADHEGEILTLQGSEILVRITCSRNPPLRRDSDRPVPLLIDLSFAERPANSPGEGASSAVESLCHVRVRTARDRDRRNSPLTAARQVCNSLKSYLMAQEVV